MQLVGFLFLIVDVGQTPLPFEYLSGRTYALKAIWR